MIAAAFFFVSVYLYVNSHLYLAILAQDVIMMEKKVLWDIWSKLCAISYNKGNNFHSSIWFITFYVTISKGLRLNLEGQEVSLL